MVGVVITVGEAKMKMKKYLKVIAILFISFGLTACANPDAWANFFNSVGQGIADGQQFQQPPQSNYRGNCPCPYDRASDGSICGNRSAYSRSGGASPKCY